MRTLINTPEAYEIITPFPQQPWIENMADFQELLEVQGSMAYDRIKQVVADEERLLGIDLAGQPEKYFAARQSFYTGFADQVELLADGLKQASIYGFAEHFAHGSESRQAEFEADFRDKLEGVDLAFSDPLVRGDGLAAHFLAASGCILVDGSSLLKVALDDRAFDDRLAAMLGHEQLHTLLTRAITYDAYSEAEGNSRIDIISRNGIQSSHSVEAALYRHLEWVNEGFIEDVRQQVFPTMAGAYPMKMAVVRTLQVLDHTFNPSLTELLESVAVKSTPPSPLTIRLEELLGPLGAEKVGAIINPGYELHPWEDDMISNTMIHDIVALVPKGLRRLANEELHAQWDIAREHLLV